MLNFLTGQNILAEKIKMYVTLEVNHLDEVSTNFMMLSIKGGCEKATYGHTP